MVSIGKHVWIIGASSGIGRALALSYAEEDWQVTVSARDEKALADLAKSRKAISYTGLDVTHPDCFAHILAEFQVSDNVPDLVIYSSATYIPGGLSVVTRDDAANHMQVNYLGLVGLVEAITPLFAGRGHGHLAVIASLSGYCGLPNAALYGPTKAALINFCETIKPDYDRLNLQISLINPGFVKTPMTDKNTFPMPFLLKAEDAADLIICSLEKTGFEITFPWPISFGMKLLHKLPYRLYFYIMKMLQP